MERKVQSVKRKVKTQSLKFLVLSLGFALCALCFRHTSFAKDISFQAAVDRNKVSLGQALQLNFSFEGSQQVPAVELPEIEGFKTRYLGPSTMMSVINGKVSSSITHMYSLLPVKIGDFKIGPFTFEHEGNTYSSNAIAIEVIKDPVQASSSPGYQQQTIDAENLSDKVFLAMELKKNKFYLNEIVPLTIKLYVNAVAIRDIHYPEVPHEGISLQAFGQPKQYQEVLNGIGYEVIEFNTTLFGIKPGEFKLGRAVLQCNFLVKTQGRQRSRSFDDFFDSNMLDDFFGRVTAYPLELKSAELPVTVLSLPTEGAPGDFSGAIGDFSMDARIGPAEVKTGDPVTVTITIEGEGNFNTVTMPKINTGNDFKVYEPQIKQEKDKKTFEQIMMPLNAAIEAVPQISFSYFDAKRGAFKTLSKGPFPLKVIKPEKEEEPKIVESLRQSKGPVVEEKLGSDIVYIKDAVGRLQKRGAFLYNSGWFLLFLALPLLGFFLFFICFSYTEKLKTDVKYARNLKAPKKAQEGLRKAKQYLAQNNTAAFYNTVFETLQDYLGDKFHLASQAITVSIIDEINKKITLSDHVRADLKDLFSQCDSARFASAALVPKDMEKTLKVLQGVIDYFQRSKVE